MIWLFITSSSLQVYITNILPLQYAVYIMYVIIGVSLSEPHTSVESCMVVHSQKTTVKSGLSHTSVPYLSE